MNPWWLALIIPVSVYFGMFILSLFSLSEDDGYIRVGRKWMSAQEYLEKYGKGNNPSCDDGANCPNAMDVTCEKCRK